jgi:hypothetical protein
MEIMRLKIQTMKIPTMTATKRKKDTCNLEKSSKEANKKSSMSILILKKKLKKPKYKKRNQRLGKRDRYG